MLVALGKEDGKWGGGGMTFVCNIRRKDTFSTIVIMLESILHLLDLIFEVIFEVSRVVGESRAHRE